MNARSRDILHQEVTSHEINAHFWVWETLMRLPRNIWMNMGACWESRVLRPTIARPWMVIKVTQRKRESTWLEK